MDFLNYLKDSQNYSKTENGATALKSTMCANLDAFALLGGMRNSDSESIIRVFEKALDEDKETAMRILFYMRDIRKGQGARRIFRVIIHWLANNYPELVINNLENILFFGRGDDYLCLFDSNISKNVVGFIMHQLAEDKRNYEAGKPISLLAKWLPSENTSSKETREKARFLIREMGILTPRQYRKLLSALRNYLSVVERKMSANEWDSINYEAVPAKAALNYSKAFARHSNKYQEYLTNVALNKAKANASSLYPVDIVHKVLSSNRNDNRIIPNAMWEALPNYFGDNIETGICIVDTSGSMSGTPLEVALSLGMYCADKCAGPYKGHFITFSRHPELIEFKGNDITDKIHYAMRADWGMNTDLEAVFDLILNTAIANKCAPNEIPAKLYIISDMQFDAATRQYPSYDWGLKEYVYPETKPFMQSMKEKYAAYGYNLPMIVYWNVRTSNNGSMFQDTFEGENCCMISGYSPALFKAVIEGTTYEEIVNKNGKREVKATLDPIEVMIAAIGIERYDCVYFGEN